MNGKFLLQNICQQMCKRLTETHSHVSSMFSNRGRVVVPLAAAHNTLLSFVPPVQRCIRDQREMRVALQACITWNSAQGAACIHMIPYMIQQRNAESMLYSLVYDSARLKRTSRCKVIFVRSFFFFFWLKVSSMCQQCQRCTDGAMFSVLCK